MFINVYPDMNKCSYQLIRRGLTYEHLFIIIGKYLGKGPFYGEQQDFNTRKNFGGFFATLFTKGV